MTRKQRSGESPLSTDVEQPFFRIRAQGSHERECSSDTPSSVTSPSSPKTGFPKRKLNWSANSREASETSAYSPDHKPGERREFSETSQYSYGHPEELGAGITREELLLSNAQRRRSSTISERARRLLGLSTSRKCSSESSEIEPPRNAREGYVWERKSSGRWIEIRIRQKAQSEVLVSKSEEAIPDFPNTLATTSIITKKDFASHDSTNSADKPAPCAIGAKVSLYDRTKHRLLFKSDPSKLGSKKGSNKDTGDYHRTNTFTMDMLQRASTILRDFAGKAKTTPSPSTSVSSQSIAAWQGRGPDLFKFRKSKGHSSSSSIQNLKMGKAPQGSPDSEAMYTGSDNQQYFRVELSAPGAPTYLPSEASRISTPPLPNADRPHGKFFFDYNLPPITNTSSNNALFPRQQRTSAMDGPRRNRKSIDLYDPQDAFDLNVPDHLPNSPLCPKNPKHRSGGKGICVYHGRNHTVPLEEFENNYELDLGDGISFAGSGRGLSISLKGSHP